MEWGIREKFKDQKLAEDLLSTGDLELIECNNWHDNFWGSCSCPKCNDSGLNHLGKILMKIRFELKQNDLISFLINLEEDINLKNGASVTLCLTKNICR